MRDIDNAVINVISELGEMGWPYQAQSETKITTFCPAHEHVLDGKTHTPSCVIDLEKKTFSCKSAKCGQYGNFIKFFCLATRQSPEVVSEYFAQRYGTEAKEKTIHPDVIERWHVELWKQPVMLKELLDRGISEEVIKEKRYGFNGERITIPIKNIEGLYVNSLFYMPGAPKNKFLSQKGRGKPRLYNWDQLSYDKIIICGGPLKADATAVRMNKLGYGAISVVSSGESYWEMAFSRQLKDKEVYVIFDIDEAGKTAAVKVSTMNKPFARGVYNVLLPLSVDKYPKGDISDYWGKENKTDEQFVHLLNLTPVFSPTNIAELLEELGAEVSIELREATNAEHIGKKIKVKAIVTSMDTVPFLVPSVVGCACDKSTAFCSSCPVFPKERNKDNLIELTIKSLSTGILPLIDIKESNKRTTLRESLGIPPCNVVEFVVKEYYNAYLLYLSPQLDITAQSNVNIVQPAYYIGTGISANSNYEFSGRILPDPKDQHAIILANLATPCVDSLDTFSPSEEILESLKVFKVDTTIDAKLAEIYADFESNITRIFFRPELHLAIDLTFHSVLNFSMDGDIKKGWVETLIIGDSSQGKSETTLKLMDHYRLGEKVDCKNASVAGLLGGVDTGGGRYIIRWGIVPKNDRRLVVLEELKGASREVIGKLTDMRSSGVAEIPKIERGKTFARTRWLALSNTRSGRAVATYTYGVQSVVDLIGSLEDIRRFDVVFILSNTQVKTSDINTSLRAKPKIVHKYTSELCRNLILWTWTRKPEQIDISLETISTLMDKSIYLCEKYSENIPIIDRGSIRYKLCRLATALAARLFSTNKALTKLVVTPEHVNYITDTIDKLYSSSSYGYADMSKALNISETIVDKDMLKKELLSLPNPKEFLELLTAQNTFDLRDICDWSGYDIDRGKTVLSLFVRKRAIVRSKGGYHKTSPFIELIKTLLNSKDVNGFSPPEYLSKDSGARNV